MDPSDRIAKAAEEILFQLEHLSAAERIVQLYALRVMLTDLIDEIARDESCGSGS